MDSCMKFSVTIMENLLLAIQMIFNDNDNNDNDNDNRFIKHKCSNELL